MKRIMKVIGGLVALLALAACAPEATFNTAAQGNPIDIQLEIYIVAANGERVAATTAKDGQTIEYRLAVTNTGSTPLFAGTTVINGPIPEGLTYIPGSARSEWGESSIYTEYERSDGTFTDNPPPRPEGVRWTFLVPFEPQAQTSFRYCVLVGDAMALSDGCVGTYSSEPTLEAASIRRYANYVLNQISGVIIGCPTWLNSTNRTSVCGHTYGEFENFAFFWENYETDIRMGVPPEVVSAWTRIGENHFRKEYKFGQSRMLVEYMLDGSDGLVHLRAPER